MEQVAGATSYKLDISTNSAFSSFVSGYGNLSVSTTNQTVYGLDGGTTYYYRVRAVNQSGQSGNSGTISIVTAPDAPAANEATNITPTSCNVSWASVPTATSYRLDVSTNSAFSSFVSGYNSLSVSTTNQTVNGLDGGTTYYYRVRAVNLEIPR